jgi:solute carrier family 25 phosphate transporter 23/24/25/41
MSTIQSFKHMYKTEGWLGGFKGNGLTVMKIAPFSAIEFYGYEVYKTKIFPGKEKNQLTFMDKILCGGLTGMTAQVLTYPLDLLKTYMTINIENSLRISMLEQTKMIIAESGPMGMFKGLGTSLVGIAPFIGIKMASYDWLMTTFGPAKGNKNTIYYNLFMGASAGTIAVTATYPVDLLRRLMQLNGSPGHIYTGLPDAIAQTWAKGGVPAFYRGLLATYLKVAPMTAILFLCNEQLKRMIKI